LNERPAWVDSLGHWSLERANPRMPSPSLESTARSPHPDQWMTVLFSPDVPANGSPSRYVERRRTLRRTDRTVADALARAGTDVILKLGLLRREHRASFYERVSDAGFRAPLHVLDAPRSGVAARSFSGTRREGNVLHGRTPSRLRAGDDLGNRSKRTSAPVVDVRMWGPAFRVDARASNRAAPAAHRRSVGMPVADIVPTRVARALEEIAAGSAPFPVLGRRPRRPMTNAQPICPSSTTCCSPRSSRDASGSRGHRVRHHPWPLNPPTTRSLRRPPSTRLG